MSIKSFLTASPLTANTIGYFFYSRRHKEETEYLKKNKKYKNLHHGERCFILGNGPSIKKEDLSALEYEIVFSVNQFSRHHDAEKVKPNYHFWADPRFFNIDAENPGDMELIQVMADISRCNPDVECFFPYDRLDFIKTYGLDKRLNINLFHSTFMLDESMNKELDYCKFTPGFNTVVEWCITLAVYMGFSEIYLLGCDNTGIINVVNTRMRTDNFAYSYEISENEKKRMEKMELGRFEDSLFSYYRTIVEYRLLNEYCSAREVKLVNCSSETVIDSLPRMALKEVLRTKNA